MSVIYTEIEGVGERKYEMWKKSIGIDTVFTKIEMNNE